MIFPKGEIVWKTYHDKSGVMRFFITSKPTRDFYYLYEVSGETNKKLGRSKLPPDLEAKFNVDKKIGIGK